MSRASVILFERDQVDHYRKVAGGFPERRIVQVDIDGLPADTADLVLPAGPRERLSAMPTANRREHRQASQEHFLHRRAREIDELNELAEAERLGAFLKKAERAYRLTVEVGKLGVGAPM